MISLLKDLKMSVSDFKNGIFDLHTRQFGKVAEILIYTINNLKESKSRYYDANESNIRVEIKASRVLKTNKFEIN